MHIRRTECPMTALVDVDQLRTFIAGARSPLGVIRVDIAMSALTSAFHDTGHFDARLIATSCVRFAKNGHSRSQLRIKDRDGRRIHYPVDRYLEEFPAWVEWSGIRIENWHRPLASYMRTLLELDLQLSFFDEPQPQSGDAERQAIYRRAPWFMVMEWRRRSAR